MSRFPSYESASSATIRRRLHELLQNGTVINNGKGPDGRPDLMDQLGPRIPQLTRPAQLDKKRFALKWVLPLEMGLSTHITLFGVRSIPHPRRGQGGDEADALLDLWTTLTDHHNSPSAVAHVAEAHHRGQS
jgi:hypothetical protein